MAAQGDGVYAVYSITPHSTARFREIHLPFPDEQDDTVDPTRGDLLVRQFARFCAELKATNGTDYYVENDGTLRYSTESTIPEEKVDISIWNDSRLKEDIDLWRPIALLHNKRIRHAIHKAGFEIGDSPIRIGCTMGYNGTTLVRSVAVPPYDFVVTGINSAGTTLSGLSNLNHRREVIHVTMNRTSWGVEPLRWGPRLLSPEQLKAMRKEAQTADEANKERQRLEATAKAKAEERRRKGMNLRERGREGLRNLLMEPQEPEKRGEKFHALFKESGPVDGSNDDVVSVSFNSWEKIYKYVDEHDGATAIVRYKDKSKSVRITLEPVYDTDITGRRTRIKPHRDRLQCTFPDIGRGLGGYVRRAVGGILQSTTTSVVLSKEVYEWLLYNRDNKNTITGQHCYLFPVTLE